MPHVSHCVYVEIHEAYSYVSWSMLTTVLTVTCMVLLAFYQGTSLIMAMELIIIFVDAVILL